jgi:hypothetical protein
MADPCFAKLDLRAPLYYSKQPQPPANQDDPDSERILCFEIDPLQGASIEPDAGNLLGKLLFSGVSNKPDLQYQVSANSLSDTVQLPAGIYLFTQIREALDRDGCIDMAIEQQKDGLWERFTLQNILYIRFLFEDGKRVTQIFRPVSA